MYYMCRATSNAGREIAACQVPNGRSKWGTGSPKILGRSSERENWKAKYSWIANLTNFDGTQFFFPIPCPEMNYKIIVSADLKIVIG